MGMGNTYPLMVVNRHRINQDGSGVFTLAAAANCPLSCEYCINKKVLAAGKYRTVTPEELYNIVKIDNLYFLATNGGVTFGGGEPLLYPDFISEFSDLVNKTWHIIVETSLNIPSGNLLKVINSVDEFYVDIKDCNNSVYKKYTGKNNTDVLKNLQLLYDAGAKEKVIIRVPLIEGYNTQKDVLNSIEQLKIIGFDHFDCFRYLLPGEQESRFKKDCHDDN